MPFASIEPNLQIFHNIYSPRGDQLDSSVPTVLLLHPRIFDHEFMAPQYTDSRLNRRFNLICADCHFHGLSKIPVDDTPYDYTKVAEDMHRVLDYLNVGACHVFGVSMGSFIAIRMAALKPDRVTSLILCATPFPTETPENIQQYIVIYEHLSKGDEDGSDNMPSDAVAAGQIVYFGKKNRPEEVHQKWLDTHPFRPSNKPLLAKILSSVIQRKPLNESEWAKLTMPVMIIHGGEDVQYPPEAARQTFACLPGPDKEIHIIDGGAHLLSYNEPAVNDLLVAFLQKQTSSV